MAQTTDGVGDKPPPAAAELAVLAEWAPELADTFVALACDIALVLDGEGRIARMAQRDADPLGNDTWIGQAWKATVSSESWPKIEQMLADVAAKGHSRRRQVNHPDGRGGWVPVAYSAVRLGPDGPMLAVGHDLSGQAQLQQRFVDAQLALERSYWHAAQTRAAEAGAEAELVYDNDAVNDPVAEGDPDAGFVLAMHRLVERVGRRDRAVLLRDVRKLAEQHFLALAVQRAGSEEELARSLGLGRRALARRLRSP